MYEPMLAAPVTIDKLDKYLDYWWEPKLDGVRCIVSKMGDVVTLTSRGGKPFTEKLPHLVEMFKNIPGSFVLDGELGYYRDQDRLPIIDFNATMRVLGSGVEEAIRKQREPERAGTQCGEIGFFAFDMLMWDGGTMMSEPNLFRRARLAEWRNKHTYSNGHVSGRSTGLLPSDIFDLTDWYPPDQRYSQEWLLDQYYEYVERGGEGMMLKNPDAPYHPGKRRANTWYKLKAFDTIDVKITGFEEGKGKYEGLIGALTFVDRAGDTGKCSGMSDSQRIEMTSELRGGHLKNKWMEIRYFGKVGADSGGYRFPQFIRLRPDLD